MSVPGWLLAALISGQFPVAPVPVAPAPPSGGMAASEPIQALGDLMPGGETVATAPALVDPTTGALLPPPAMTAVRPFADAEARGLFESDHAFDDFVGPLSNPVQFKDPRSLTEARLLFMNNYGRPSTPVLGSGSIQVYALQLRLAVTERLQLFADKDGIVRLSPNPGESVTGLANIAAGAKYVFIRDVPNQFLFSGVVQYEAPTGYANIFQNQGSGNLALYGVMGKEFGDDWHFLLQFGQNFRMKTTNSGYFMTSAHLDRRFGKLVPFYEANWFYYNQNGTFLPIPLEGGGWINIGASDMAGVSWVTNAVGFKYDFNEHLELGVAYEFQGSEKTQLLNDMILAELILRY